MATILIADDDSASRLLLRTLLEHDGHRVIAASDGAQALAMVETEKPDMLVTDLSMPGLAGAKLVRRARAKAGKGLRIALYTATPPNDAMRDFMEIYDVRTLIAKPAEPAMVLEQIRAALAP